MNLTTILLNCGMPAPIIAPLCIIGPSLPTKKPLGFTKYFVLLQFYDSKDLLNTVIYLLLQQKVLQQPLKKVLLFLLCFAL